MTSREGVIKFALDFQPGPAPDRELLTELEAWRTIFRRLGLLGQDPARYEGLGFGNLSRRTGSATAPDRFVISGTQTGGLHRLTPQHYTLVLKCTPAGNRVAAKGPLPPSSEALSHGVLYQLDQSIEWVMHLHSPEIFAAAQRLSLPTTAADAPYGSPQMADEICRLAPVAGWPGLLVMGGHEDGILVYGPTANATGALAVDTLAKALASSHGEPAPPAKN